MPDTDEGKDELYNLIQSEIRSKERLNAMLAEVAASKNKKKVRKIHKMTTSCEITNCWHNDDGWCSLLRLKIERVGQNAMCSCRIDGGLL